MSYILEALKKSDRERRQGKVPDLETVQDPHYRGGRRRQFRPFLLLGLLAICMAVLLGAWILWRGEEPPSRTAVATTEPEEAPAMAPVPVAAPDVPPLASTGDQPDSNPDQTRGDESPEPAEAAQTAEPAASPAAAPEPLPNAGDALEIAPEAAMESEMEEQTPPSGDITEARVVKLEDLPADLKADLPEIKIGVHLYRDEPEGRRASINGRLLREGQSVEPGLYLEEITRQGAILSFRGHRFSVAVFPR